MTGERRSFSASEKVPIPPYASRKLRGLGRSPRFESLSNSNLRVLRVFVVKLSWLGKEDSNLHYLIQSQACYHCTIPQCKRNYTGGLVRNQENIGVEAGIRIKIRITIRITITIRIRIRACCTNPVKK